MRAVADLRADVKSMVRARVELPRKEESLLGRGGANFLEVEVK